ncbi:MAG TPA: polysaccharide biosynthesis protein [Patescibacteria group bacterium]|nr:polysaccharide biosynthesis protein [Patescibacteria group bacterium]
MTFYKGKTCLITGGGSLGRELVTILIEREAREVRIFDNSEQQLYKCELEFRRDPQVSYLLGDVGDLDAVEKAMLGINLVIHTAACKFVNYVECHPFPSIHANVQGTINVVKAAIKAPFVQKAIVIGSDKACNPCSIYGHTKALQERLFTYASRVSQKAFCTVRFPNFYGSDGSVIQTWQKQGEEGLPITLTDKEMARYFVGLREAAELTLEALEFSEGGDIFVPADVPERRILEIAEEFSEKYGVPIKLIGRRVGERLHEPLMTEEEREIATREGRFWRIDAKREYLGTAHYLYDTYRGV